MAENVINYGKMITEAVHRPSVSCASGRVVPLYARTSYKESEAETREPEFLEQSQRVYSSPDNIRRVYIGSESVAVELFTSPVGKDGTFMTSKIESVQGKKCSGNPFAFIKSHVLSNIEEIYFGPSFMKACMCELTGQNYVLTKDFINELATLLGVELDMKTIWASLIRKYVSSQRGTDAELKRIRIVGYCTDIDGFIKNRTYNNKIKDVDRFNMTALEEYGDMAFGKTIFSVVCGDGEQFYNNNWGRIGDRTVCKEFVVKEGIYKFDAEKLAPIRSKLNDHLIEIQTKANEAKKAKEVKKEEPKEEKKDSIDNKEIENFVQSMYGKKIVNAVNIIKKVYTGLFASGYGVIEPDGLLIGTSTYGGGYLHLTTEDENGNKTGISRAVVEEDSTLIDLYEILRDAMGIKESKERVINFGLIAQGYNYFPYKLLEYAFGRFASSPEDIANGVYKKHSSAKSWHDVKGGVQGYWSTAIEKNLMRDCGTILCQYISSQVANGKSIQSREDVKDMTTGIDGMLESVIKAYTPCIIISEMSEGRVKIRVSDVEAILSQGRGRLDGFGTASKVQSLIHQAVGLTYESTVPIPYCDGAIKEFEVIKDPNLCGAMPLFAYTALEKLKQRGEKPNWDNVILGRAEDDSVYMANNGTSKVDLIRRTSVIHITAGSRSGKGVMTLNLLASSVASGIPLFYLDSKPDMAALLRGLANMGKTFAIHGGKYEGAADDKKLFVPNGPIYAGWDTRLPDCVKGDNELNGFEGWTAMQYFKALDFCIYLMSKVGKNDLATYGVDVGTDNMIVVADELWRFIGDFSVLLNKLKTLRATDASMDNGKATDIGIYARKITDWQDKATKSWKSAKNATLRGTKPCLIAIYQELEPMTSKTKYGPDILDDGPLGNSSVYRALLEIGTEGIVGYSATKPHTIANTPKGRKFMTEAGRYFAYVPNIMDQKEEDAEFFKPFLILNDAVEDESNPTNYVGQLKGQMAKCELDSDKVLAKHRDANGQLRSEIGFPGYIAALSDGDPSALQSVLVKSYDLANKVLQRMGYFEASGGRDVFDFLLDFRPEFLLSWGDMDKALLTGKIDLGEAGSVSVGMDIQMGGSFEQYGDGSLEEEPIDFGSDFEEPVSQPATPIATATGTPAPSKVEQVVDAKNPFGAKTDGSIFEELPDEELPDEELPDDELNMDEFNNEFSNSEVTDEVPEEEEIIIGDGFSDDLGNTEETMNDLFKDLNGAEQEDSTPVGEQSELVEDAETREQRTSYGRDRMNQPFCKPNSEKATDVSGNRNNKMLVNGSGLNPARKLDINKAIDCSQANRGISERYENILAKTFRGQKILRNKLWQGILNKIVSGPGGIPATQVVRVVITEDEIMVNGKQIYLDGVVGGSGLHIEDIADFKLLFKKFPGIIELCTTETVASARSIEENVNTEFVTYLFDTGKNLRTAVLYMGGKNYSYDRKAIREAKIAEKLEEQRQKMEAKSNYDAFCKQPRETHINKTNDLNSRASMARAAKTSFGRAKENFKSSKGTSLFKGIGWGLAGVTVGTFSLLSGIIGGGASAFREMRK